MSWLSIIFFLMPVCGILRRIINDWQPYIIHFHYPNPFVTALLLPLIPKETKLYMQWHLYITKHKNFYPFIKPLETKLLKSTFSAISSAIKEESKRSYSKTNSPYIIYVGNIKNTKVSDYC